MIKCTIRSKRGKGRRTSTKIFFLTLLYLFVVFCPFSNGQNTTRNILGSSRASVRRVMGRPYLVERGGSYSIEYWRAPNPQYYIRGVFHKGTLVQAETDSPLFKTASRVSVLSKLSMIRNTFRTIKAVNFKASNGDYEHSSNYYISGQDGIAFELNLGYSPDASPNTMPHALIIYKRRSKFVPVFGKFVWSSDSSK